MSKPLRLETAFTPEFLRHAHAEGFWPAETSVKIHCRERGIAFMKNGLYPRLSRGEYCDERHVRVVLHYLLDPAHEQFPERRKFDEYLKSMGVKDTRALSVSDALGLVSVFQEVPDDGYGLGTEVLLWTFRRIPMPSRYARRILKEHEVREAIGWICVEAGRQLTSPDLPPFQALIEAKARMGLSMDAYQDLAVAWWRRNWRTVMHTVDEHGNPNGMCIALPVTEAFYQRCRRGECTTHDCALDDVEPVSSALVIVNGVAPKPDLGPKGPGLSLIMGGLCQQAAVSDVPGICIGVPLKLLLFSGTPVGTRRAKRFGFKQLGTFWPGTTIEYLERTLQLGILRLADTPLVGIWLGLQLHLRDVYRERPPLEGPSPEAGPETA